jgi:hypothetical protein
MRIDPVVTAQTGADFFFETNNRLNIPDIQASILGGLAYLKDTQVNHAKSHTLKYHHLRFGKNAGNHNRLNIPCRLRAFAGNQLFREAHLEGSWPGFVTFQPNRHGRFLSALFTATDYNLFTTASTANCLFYFDDGSLPDEQRFVSAMLGGAFNAIQGFRRGHAYNFWRTLRHSLKGFRYSIPLNIPLAIIDFRRFIYERTNLMGLHSFHEADAIMDWLDRIYNRQENPSGSSALFNIPDDSDNTSMAVGFQLMYERWKGSGVVHCDLSPLDLIPMFRDVDRKLTDRHNAVLGQNTGAFLTWLKEESQPVFSAPGKGIIPLAVNNVDIVVNANVLFTLSLAGRVSVPGYREATGLLAKVVREGTWRKASLYYPEKLFLPYALTRAMRDGGLDDPRLHGVMVDLLVWLLEDQQALEERGPRHAGPFPGNGLGSTVMTTALRLIALLNIGRSVAGSLGLEGRYDETVNRTVRFLISARKKVPPGQPETGRMLAGILPNYWESGILYSSSLQQLAYWHSHAQATSLVLEALAKYVLGYDRFYRPEQKSFLRLTLREAKLRLEPA